VSARSIQVVLLSSLVLTACNGGTVASQQKRPPGGGDWQRVGEPSAQPPQAQAHATTAPASGTPQLTLEYEPIGRARIKHRGADALTFQYLFFGIPWTWQRIEAREQRPEGGKTNFSVKVPGLGIEIEGVAAPTAQNELTFEYTVRAKEAHKGIVGGGLEFKLSPELIERSEKPELLPDHRGLRWEIEKGQVIEVEASESLGNVYMELGKAQQIRMFFVPKDVTPGERKFQIRLRVPKGLGGVQKSAAERYGAGPDASWHTDTLLWDQWPVDLRFLNEGGKPAGIHGAVQAKGDALVFADGTPAKLWGTNLQAAALFQTTKEQACRQAERIAAFGYNLVRFHHHDSGWVKPNVFDLSSGTTQKLDPKSLDALDHWMKCLAEQGVYMFLDIHVGRVFERGDNVPGFSEMNRELHAKGYSFVNPRIEQLMQQFAHSYLEHKNPYRGGQRYADDPAIAAIAITNENDLTHHFVHRMNPNRGAPEHAKMLQSALDKLTSARGMDEVDVREVWRPGEPSIAVAGLEGAFFQRAIADLNKLGVKKPTSTTSHWGASTFLQLPAVAMPSLVDVHSYGDAEYLNQDPRGVANILHWIAGAQITGKPLAITEWALEYDRRDRFVIPVHFAAVAALQGWDMPMHFTYQQVAFVPPRRVQPGSNSYDPAIMAMMPAAALMFRRGDVSPAKKSYVLQLSKKDVYEDRHSVKTSATVRTLTEQSRISLALPNIPELDWDDGFAQSEPGATVIKEVDRDFIPAGQHKTLSDTGEIFHDWSAGYFTVDTARTQAAGGFIGGRTLALEAVTLKLTTPKAAVAVSSLDGAPIGSSQRILLTTVAQVVAGEDGSLPYRAQPVSGELSIKSTQPLVLVPLTPGGREQPAIAPARSAAGVLTFPLPDRVATHYFLLRVQAAKGP
jgi:hypothetical protein